MKMKKPVRAIACALLLAALAALIIGAAKRDGDAIYENTLRLHVVASSDSEEDQALKLKVRDCVLALLSEPIESCSCAEEAKKLLEEDEETREEIKAAAQKVVADEGFDYPVNVELVRGEVFPRKTYGRATLPAGRYDALRVTIGEGEGHNWWCVLYPPLCMTLSCSDTDAGGEEEEKLAAAGFTPGQVALITGSSPGEDGGEGGDGRMKIKLRIVEIVEALFDKIAPGRNRKENY